MKTTIAQNTTIPTSVQYIINDSIILTYVAFKWKAYQNNTISTSPTTANSNFKNINNIIKHHEQKQQPNQQQ